MSLTDPPSNAHTANRDDLLLADGFSRSATKSLRSLGWELGSLKRAGQLLAARVRKGTLPTPLIAFLVPIMAEPGLSAEDTSLQTSPLRVVIEADLVKVMPDALQEFGVSASLLAMLHLPALRSFWSRALRKSHFDRLRRLLPRAWFVTKEPTPMGAVVPGLGITSWNQMTDSSTFRRVPTPTGDVLIEDVQTDGARAVVAHYTHAGSGVYLSSVA